MLKLVGMHGCQIGHMQSWNKVSLHKQTSAVYCKKQGSPLPEPSTRGILHNHFQKTSTAYERPGVQHSSLASSFGLTVDDAAFRSLMPGNTYPLQSPGSHARWLLSLLRASPLLVRHRVPNSTNQQHMGMAHLIHNKQQSCLNKHLMLRQAAFCGLPAAADKNEYLADQQMVLKPMQAKRRN